VGLLLRISPSSRVASSYCTITVFLISAAGRTRLGIWILIGPDGIRLGKLDIGRLSALRVNRTRWYDGNDVNDPNLTLSFSECPLCGQQLPLNKNASIAGCAVIDRPVQMS